MKKKSLPSGEPTSVSVENITLNGVWHFLRGKEYFLDFEEFPYFRDHPVKSIHNVKLLHGFHLYWPDLDVDLEIDNLENPARYLLKSKIRNTGPEGKPSPAKRSRPVSPP